MSGWFGEFDGAAQPGPVGCIQPGCHRRKIGLILLELSPSLEQEGNLGPLVGDAVRPDADDIVERPGDALVSFVEPLVAGDRGQHHVEQPWRVSVASDPELLMIDRDHNIGREKAESLVVRVPQVEVAQPLAHQSNVRARHRDLEIFVKSPRLGIQLDRPTASDPPAERRAFKEFRSFFGRQQLDWTVDPLELLESELSRQKSLRASK